MDLFVAGNFDSKTDFNFNSDLSGGVLVKLHDGRRFEVPGSHLMQFAAEVVRRAKIAALEDAKTEDILGLPKSA